MEYLTNFVKCIIVEFFPHLNWHCFTLSVTANACNHISLIIFRYDLFSKFCRLLYPPMATLTKYSELRIFSLVRKNCSKNWCWPHNNLCRTSHYYFKKTDLNVRFSLNFQWFFQKSCTSVTFTVFSRFCIII